MMEKAISKNCIVNYPSSLKELSIETIQLLNEKIIEYEKIFKVKLNEPIIVNYFDDIEKFRKFIYDIRQEESLPEYAKGTYDEGMVNAYIEPDKQIKRKYTAPHELFHIMYMKYILNNDYSIRIIWYDEGMAQFMSGEKEKYSNKEKFREYYLKIRSNTKTIPRLNKLIHGESFINDEYNAYDLSYLSIRYLSETLPKDEFNDLMSNYHKIKKYGEDIVEKMFKYYDKLFTY